MGNRTKPNGMVHLDDSAVIDIAAKRLGESAEAAARELVARLERRSEPGRSRLAELCRQKLGRMPHEMVPEAEAAE